MADKGKKKPPPFVRTETIKLPENHSWKVTPGHQICVIGRGDLRFEVSILRTPPVDVKRLPALSDLLLDNLHKQGHLFTPDQIRAVEAPGLELAWAEYDKIENDAATDQPRPATWRQAHCHPGRFYRGKYVPVGIITFGFWIDHRERADAVWQHVVSTLVMGEQIADPRVGPRYN
jgi:hypothetical protein